MLIDEKLFSLWRGEAEEIAIRGEVIVHNGETALWHSGNDDGSYPARSLLKPFQFLATRLPRKEWENPVTKNRFAACMGSISATRSQVQQLEEWYRPAFLEKNIRHLKFRPTYPMDETHRVFLKYDQKPAVPIFHTCFSKHMAILQACHTFGWNHENYNQATHPFHDSLLKTLSALLHENLDGVHFVEDGCSLPTPIFQISQLASLYQKLASAADSTELGAIRNLMLSNPEWIGGPGRVDTQLMLANSGKLVAKEGADGLWGLAILPSDRFKKGLGIILKLAPGYLPAMASIALTPVLEAVGLKGVSQVPKGHSLKHETTVKL